MMNTNDTLEQAAHIDSSGQNQLLSSGKWTKFIGIVYLVLAVLLVLITIALFANMQMIANAFMNLNGMSSESLEFLMGAGKWLFGISMALSCFILLLNGLFMVRYGRSTKAYAMFHTEEALTNSFKHLTHYLMLTTILSILSTFTTLAAIAFYLIM